MNSDSSELETSSNGLSIFMPPPPPPSCSSAAAAAAAATAISRLSATAATSSSHHHHQQQHQQQQQKQHANITNTSSSSNNSNSSNNIIFTAVTAAAAAAAVASSTNSTHHSSAHMNNTGNGMGAECSDVGGVGLTYHSKMSQQQQLLPSLSMANGPHEAANESSSGAGGGGGDGSCSMSSDYNAINETIVSSAGIGVHVIGGGGGGGSGGASLLKYAANESKPQERYVWEMRTRSPNVTPASTVLNSPDLNTDVQYALHHHHHHHHSHSQHHSNRQHHHHHSHPHHQIRVGRSPVSQFEQHDMLPQGLTSPGSPTDVGKAGGQCLRDGEIVVFDDIDTSWMNNRCSTSAAVFTATATNSNTNNAAINNNNNNNCSSSSNNNNNSSHNGSNKLNMNNNNTKDDGMLLLHNEDVLKVTKMIGQLPIAEYEGSPRRFGNQPVSMRPVTAAAAAAAAATTTPTTVAATASAFPKRPPGFPQRISPMSAGGGAQQLSAQQSLPPASTQPQQQQPTYNPQHKVQLQQYYGLTSSMSANAISNDNKRTMGNNLIDIDDDSVSGGDGDVSAAGAGVGGGGGDGGSKAKTPTFDYLYEFSETRKVLEEFFKGNPEDEKRYTDDDVGGSSCDTHQDYEREKEREREEEKHIEQAYIGQRLARIPKDELYLVHRSPRKQQACDNVYNEHNDIELYIDSNSRSSGELADTELEANMRRHSRNFTLSPETTDYDSNCGDLDSLSNDINCPTDYGKLYTSMPVLEDGLSSGHASDTENNGTNTVVGCCGVDTNMEHNKQMGNDKAEVYQHQQQQQEMLEQNEYNASLALDENAHMNIDADLITDLLDVGGELPRTLSPHQQQQQQQQQHYISDLMTTNDSDSFTNEPSLNTSHELMSNESNYDVVYAAVAAAASNTSVMTVGKHSPPPIAAEQQIRSLLPNSALRSKQQQQQQQQHQQQQQQQQKRDSDIQEAMKEIRSALQRAKTQPEKLKFCDEVLPPGPESPVWVPRQNGPASGIAAAVASSNSNGGSNNALNNKLHCDEEEADTDLETDRLLGQQRLDDQAYYDDKTIWPKTSRIGCDSNQASPTTSDVTMLTNNSNSISNSNNNNNNNNSSSNGNGNGSNKPQSFSSATIRQGIGTSLTPNTPEHCQIVGSADVTLTSPEKLQYSKSPTGSIKSLKDSANSDKKAKSRNKEGLLPPAVLIEGVLFRARYLGSTQLVCEGQPTKSTRMLQAEEAVSRIKAPEGESQPSTEVDLFISTEKIMVLNTDLKEIMMDHALRTISYIADIGDLVVLMARRRFVPSDACQNSSDSGDGGGNDSGQTNSNKETKETVTNGGGGGANGGNSSSGGGGGGGGSNKHNRTPKMICHVFESDEAQFIAQSIGQAFQVAYMEFLKANGIEDHSFVKEMDYQEVLNSQEIFGDELEIFAKKELQKEVVVPKAKGEILGVVIVESGWGSMLPTVVIANLMSTGAAARCGQLNIGDQLIAINGMSLVGLPLSTCQSYIRNAKNQTAVKFTVVPCAPVVEVKIKRPNTKYQLGFSVQNGVICSLLRGGIAERGGVRVGHRIIEINNQSVVAVPHEKIVNLLATSVGEILMKTMPTSMFRLLTGQENPIYI